MTPSTTGEGGPEVFLRGTGYFGLQNEGCSRRQMYVETRDARVGGVRSAILVTGFGLLHFVAIYAGYEFYFGEMAVATMWPGSGLFMGVLIVSPVRRWPYLIVAAGLAQAAVDIEFYHTTVLNSVLFVSNNAVEAVVGAVLLRKFCRGIPDLRKLRDVVALAFIGALFSTFTSALGGAGIVSFFGGADYWRVFQVWWFADAVGVLACAPLVLAVADRDLAHLTRRPKRLVEFAIVFTAMLAAIHLVFASAAEDIPFALNAPYILSPFLLWFAARFSAPAMALALFVASCLVIVHSDRGTGPFVADGHSVQMEVLTLQLFLVIQILTNLLLFAGLSERNRAHAERAALERQLLQAQKLDSLGTLAGGIAHDFNNVLQVVLAYCGLAKEDNDGRAPELDDHLNSIEDAAHRGAQVVQQILTFSRPSNADAAPILLKDSVLEVIKFLRSSIPATIQVECRLDEDCPYVLANANHIQQVLTNLCTNSVHALQDRSGTLRIELEHIVTDEPMPTVEGTLPRGAYVQLSVVDNGSGIAPEHMDRLLDPFFTTKEVGKGTGLGLTMVRSIVKANRGGLRIESERNVGTAVRVLLPALDDAAAAKSPAPDPGEHILGSGTILVIDDEKVIAKSTAAALERRGFEVKILTNPRKAVQYVRSRPGRLDLIVVDYTMPGMTGLELAAALYQFAPEIPVIMVSGILDEDWLRTVQPANVRELVGKPFTSDQLVAAVARVLVHTVRTSETGRR